MTLTELSIKRPTIIVVIFTVLAVVGIFSYSQLKYELLPKITPPWITIITVYPGASPHEVESSVTKVIEDAISGIDKVSSVYGTSQEGLSIVSLEFLMTADINVALQDAQRKVSEVASRLPADAKDHSSDLSNAASTSLAALLPSARHRSSGSWPRVAPTAGHSRDAGSPVRDTRR